MQRLSCFVNWSEHRSNAHLLVNKLADFGSKVVVCLLIVRRAPSLIPVWIPEWDLLAVLSLCVWSRRHLLSRPLPCRDTEGTPASSQDPATMCKRTRRSDERVRRVVQHLATAQCIATQQVSAVPVVMGFTIYPTITIQLDCAARPKHLKAVQAAVCGAKTLFVRPDGARERTRMAR